MNNKNFFLCFLDFRIQDQTKKLILICGRKGHLSYLSKEDFIRIKGITENNCKIDVHRLKESSPKI